MTVGSQRNAQRAVQAFSTWHMAPYVAKGTKHQTIVEAALTSRKLLSALVLLGALFASGCATVQPWQRGRLTNPCMVFDANGHQLAFDTHWQTAREAAAGGFGVQSGGCGCK